jgi:hypothetical protein
MFRISLNALYQTLHPYWLSSLVQLLLAILTKRQHRSVINPLQLANHHPRPAVQQEEWHQLVKRHPALAVQSRGTNIRLQLANHHHRPAVQYRRQKRHIQLTQRHTVNCPVTMQPLLMEDGTVMLGECINTRRWIKARRISRRLFLWACTQTNMAIYVTSQHLRSGGGETDPLVEFRNRVRARLQFEYAYYMFVNNIDCFIDFWCFNDILCSIVGDKLKLIVNV